MRRNAMENRALVFTLYLCVVTKRWSIWLPPQVTKAGLGSLADLTFTNSSSRPRDEFRLAGSLVSADAALWGNVPILIPEFDGIHLQVYTSAWAALSASLVVQGKTIAAKPSGVFVETYSGIDQKLQKNVRL